MVNHFILNTRLHHLKCKVLHSFKNAKQCNNNIHRKVCQHRLPIQDLMIWWSLTE
ncbi:hypothetical protein LINPERPRIM_LOCUS21005 [Linum perenne]